MSSIIGAAHMVESYCASMIKCITLLAVFSVRDTFLCL